MMTSDNKNYYEFLGVSKNVSPEDLKEAYEKALEKNHSCSKLVNEIHWVYATLSNPSRRILHDDLNDPHHVFGMEDLVKVRRGEDLVHHLKVSLQNLYHGTTKKFIYSRTVLCSTCNGKGTKSGASMACQGCKGSGMKISLSPFSPGIMQRMNIPCNECNGVGESINDEDRCPSCKGEKVVTEKKEIQLHVEKGMQIGQKIIFPGEAAEAPDTITGDLVFVLQPKE